MSTTEREYVKGRIRMKKFVYLTETIAGVEKNEVGILEEQGEKISKVRFVRKDYDISVENDRIIEFEPDKTGDQFEQKICNVCNKLLPIAMFQKNQNGINNRTVRRPSCNACREVIDGVKISARDRHKMEEIKPYGEIWECPVCHKRTIPGITSKVVLDHNHETGKPRAWICDSCNTGLGRFKDDTGIMRNAIEYLNQYEK